MKLNYLLAISVFLLAFPCAADEAVETTVKAAEMGNADAQSALGSMYENGKGMPKNQNEAIKWYKKAAENGSAEAQNNLGYIYANGRGVPKNLTQAIRLYSKSAEQGLPEAQYNLGVMYTNGLATPVDYVKAYMWANLAASKNNQNAIRMRSMLEKNLPNEQIIEGQRLSKDWQERHAPLLPQQPDEHVDIPIEKPGIIPEATPPAMKPGLIPEINPVDNAVVKPRQSPYEILK